MKTDKKINKFPTSELDLVRCQDIPLHDRIRIVEGGITKRELEAFKKLMDVDYEILSELLMLTPRSVHLKKGENKFSSIVSDRIMMLLELYSFGCTIFGSLILFDEWMKSPNERMLDDSPLTIIKTHSVLLTVREALSNIRGGQF